ncbi:MAG: M24 family metallopeptidase [Planctomyces sp.]
MNDTFSDDARPRRQLIQDADRVADVELKHQRVRQLLAATGADALLLQDPANIAWFAAGADMTRGGSESCQTSVFVTEDARLFATNSVDSTLIFEREAFGLGFQLKQREWFQPHSELIDDLTRGRRVISDTCVEGTRGASRRIAQIRLPLTALEVTRLKKLCSVVVHAVEATAVNIRSGQTEASVAGEVAHRLIKRTVTPVRIQVAADGRNLRYRHWPYSEDPIESYATVCCVARRWGLHAAVARTVAIDRIPPELWEAHQKAVLIHATGMFFSRNEESVRALWPRVQRIYEKFNIPCEWQLSDQADVMGYRSSEVQLTPDGDHVLQAPSAVFWHPSVGMAMPGDMVLISETGTESLTRSTMWPELEVRVKGRDVPCCGILRTARTGDSASELTTSPQNPKTGDETGDSAEFVLMSNSGTHDRVDSIWEMELAAGGRSVLEGDESQFSGESVLD